MNILSIDKLAKYINVDDIPEEWIKYDREARESFSPHFIKIDEDVFLFYEFNDEFKSRVIETLDIVRKDINLSYLVYLWYYILFLSSNKELIKWDTKPYYFKDNGTFMMPVIVLLMGYKKHIETFRVKEFDDKQIEYSKNNLKKTCIYDSKRFNIEGIRFSQMIWGYRVITGKIIQVGCLQYEIKDEFYNGKTVVYIHIPWNTSLDSKDLDYSLNNASKYVKKYLGRDKFLYVTETWMLSSDLLDILDENSKILQFQKRFYVIRERENIKDFLNFVFNVFDENINYLDLKDDTRLRKGIKDKLLNKEKLHIGLGILKTNVL